MFGSTAYIYNRVVSDKTKIPYNELKNNIKVENKEIPKFKRTEELINCVESRETQANLTPK